jgi:hypothetical protein
LIVRVIVDYPILVETILTITVTTKNKPGCYNLIVKILGGQFVKVLKEHILKS